MWTISLLPLDVERARFLRALPRTDDRALRQMNVLDLAVDYVGDGSGLVFCVGLKVHDPPIRIERRVLDGHVVGAGVDHPADRFAVPVQHDDDVGAVSFVAGPGADPGSLQWVPL